MFVEAQCAVSARTSREREVGKERQARNIDCCLNPLLSVLCFGWTNALTGQDIQPASWEEALSIEGYGSYHLSGKHLKKIDAVSLISSIQACKEKGAQCQR